MTSNKKLNELRVIPLVVFLSSSFLIIVTYMLLSDIPLISSHLEDYIISGNSFFFPTFPNINILWFLPQKYQILPITIGQCIDLIIILNLTCYVESLIYHYIKWTILNKDCQVIYNLYSFYLNTTNKNSEMCEDFELIQDLRIKNLLESTYISSVNYKLDWKKDLIHILEGKKKYRSCLGHKRKDFGPFKLILKIYINYYLILCNYLKYFWTIRLKIRYPPPDIINLADFVEQEGGKVILKIDLMDFLKKIQNC